MECFFTEPARITRGQLVRGMEIVMAANWVWLGLQVLLPPDSFQGVPTWQWFYQHGGTMVWGLIFSAIGALCVYSLHSRQPRIRKITALVSAIFNGLIVAGVMVAAIAATAWGTYLIHTALSYWIMRLVSIGDLDEQH